MMDWTARLADRRAKNLKPPSCIPTKPTKPPFVSFVSKQDGHSENIAVDPAAIRGRLLALAESEYRDPALAHALPASFLRDCDGMDTAAMRAMLSMLADDADRRALRRPKDDTAAILCRKCGPVWIHPSIAAVLPVVDGWPRALGCPWCFIHPKEGMAIPRPK